MDSMITLSAFLRPYFMSRYVKYAWVVWTPNHSKKKKKEN